MKKIFLLFFSLYLFQFSIIVNAQTWDTPIIVTDGGSTNSLKIVNGSPAIAYNFGANLKYVRAIDTFGKAWQAPVQVDVTGDVGRFISMQIIKGNPAISFYDETKGHLKYVRSANIMGDNWFPSVAIDVSGVPNIFRSYTSLMEVNGNPAIAYCHTLYFFGKVSGFMKYVRSSDPSGITWAQPVCVDCTGAKGEFNSMQIVDGYPAISYFDFTSGDLRFRRASDLNGANWSSIYALDVTGDVGFFTSMQIVNGNPAIAYYDLTNGDLKYMYARDKSGGSWFPPIKVDTIGDVGRWASLQVVNGNPAIAYYDFTNGDLKYISAMDSIGTNWASSPVIVDSTGNVGLSASMQTKNGVPSIAYYDATNKKLKFVTSSIITRTKEINLFDKETSISPNPVNDKFVFTLLSNYNSDYNILLTDMNGKLFSNLKSNASSLEIDMTNYSAGCYFITVVDNNGNQLGRKKILKL